MGLVSGAEFSPRFFFSPISLKLHSSVKHSGEQTKSIAGGSGPSLVQGGTEAAWLWRALGPQALMLSLVGSMY